ncbi:MULTISPECIES: NADPH-dependent F420 reductase [Spongiibacter]|uniref:NADPH-dependent F420 reductase n=1 Tax=Spongiibacter TaxID=630749 RepID=UPI000C5DF7F8|nr:MULTISPECIES: NADPH-dependent F420 reductase [Spongiibacter]MBO6753810.1 NADPH-dependent F420 reductase [Spongiibacter sp.]MBU70823.1 NADPH-dependent F420 reductase [Spongiibacter sp.]|tara:strand:+ start:35008 stop:35676 length:669 start_codon:yes stop_codon:yes gene_type:complete
MNNQKTLAVLGGTGNEGKGLALRWANAGYKVILGSRSAEKAAEVAEEMNAILGSSNVSGSGNVQAAEQADIAVLTVPYSAQRAVVEEVQHALSGKILVDVTVPLKPPRVFQVQLPDNGSAVQAVQTFLGDGVKVVSAFQNISAHHLTDLDYQFDCEVLVCGDDAEACETVIQMSEAIGLHAWHAGVLANSVVAEALTSVLIAINKRYKTPSAGIRITGVNAA